MKLLGVLTNVSEDAQADFFTALIKVFHELFNSIWRELSQMHSEMLRTHYSIER